MFSIIKKISSTYIFLTYIHLSHEENNPKNVNVFYEEFLFCNWNYNLVNDNKLQRCRGQRPTFYATKDQNRHYRTLGFMQRKEL